MNRFLLNKKNIMVCLVGIFLASCSSVDDEQVEVLLMPVTVATPNVRDLPLYVDAIGVLAPSSYVEIRPQVSGMIEKIFVKEGEDVIAGQPLIELDSKSYRIREKEAQAQLLMDQIAYEAARKKLERFQKLAQKDLVAQVEWDEIEMQAEKGKVIVELDRARLEAVQLDLERCTLRAPQAGKIGRMDIHAGNLVSKEQSNPLLMISQDDPLIVNFHVTEKELAKLPKESLKIEVIPLCDKECSGAGHVTFFDARFDAQSGLMFMRGELDNDEKRFFAGQSIKVRLQIALEPKVTFISQKAVKFNQQGPYVYTVNQDHVIEFHQIKLGEEMGEEVAVLEGVLPEDRLITSSHARLSPGMKVEVQ